MTVADVMKIEIKIFIDSAGFISLFNFPRKYAFGDLWKSLLIQTEIVLQLWVKLS